MARRATLAIQEQDDLDPDATAVAEEADEAVAESTARPGRGSASEVSMMMMFSVACLLGGIVLALGPKLSWKLTQITEGAAYLGIHSGALIIGGLVIAGLALLRRGQVGMEGTADQQAEDRTLIEQLATDGLQMKHAVEQLSRTMSSMTNQVSELRGEIDVKLRETITALKNELPRLAPTPLAPAGGGQQDALFMLAASLDQVGERIELRLKNQFDTLQDHFEDIGASILSARHSMDEMLHGGERRPAAAEVTSWTPDATRGPTPRPTNAPLNAARPNAPRHTGGQSGGPMGAINPNGPNGSASGMVVESPLGVLDLIDDEHMYFSPDARLESIGAALPAEHDTMARTLENQWSEDALSAAPEVPAVSMQRQALDTQTKLIQLSTLLSDERLRAALDKMRPTK